MRILNDLVFVSLRNQRKFFVDSQRSSTLPIRTSGDSSRLPVKCRADKLHDEIVMFSFFVYLELPAPTSNDSSIQPGRLKVGCLDTFEHCS